MLDVLFEQELVQNIGLGAEAIFEAVAAYYKREKQMKGLPFPMVFLVLPLIFHKKPWQRLSQGQAWGLCERR